MKRPRYVTVCTVCGDDPGVAKDWNNLHYGRAEWRVSRHVNRKLPRLPNGKRPVCRGSRLEVPSSAVFDTRGEREAVA